MDPTLLASLGGTAANLLFTAISDAIAAGDKQKAIKLYEEAYEKAKGIKPPPQQTMEAITQAESSLVGYQEDPALKAAQMRALEGLGAEVSMQGMTPEARAEYDRARLEAGQMAAGLEGAAAQRARQRGLGGMGAYVGALGASQAAANRAGQMGVQIAGDARKRYLQALEGLGGLGSKVRGQEFDIAAQRASAQDAINRFNALQRTQAQQYNLEAGQRDFENQLAALNAMQGASGRLAGAYQGRAEDTQETGRRYGGAAERGARAAGYAYESGQAGAAAKAAWEKSHPGQEYPYWKKYGYE